MPSSVLKNVIHPKAQTSPLIKSSPQIASNYATEDEDSEPENMSDVLGVLVENAPVAMAMFDGAMRYVLANRQWIREFGLQHVQPLVGRSQYEIFPNLHPGWRQVYERALQGHIVRSEHDAGGQNMVYRWEVRPWRKQRDTRVGGLMVTCEKFRAGTTDSDDHDRDDAGTASQAHLRQPDPFDCSLPMLMLDDTGIIHRANAVAAHQSLEKGIQEGKTTFWELFATNGEGARLRQEWHETVEKIRSGSATNSQTIRITLPDNGGALRWIISALKSPLSKDAAPSVPMLTAVGLSATLLPVEKVIEKVIEKVMVPAVASAPVLFPPAPESRALPPAPALPAVSGAELQKLKNDLSRAQQELRTMQEAERAFVKREARLRSFLEGAPCGIFVLDERGMPIYQNERLARLLGRPLAKDESVETWLAQACPTPEHREHVTLAWRESVWRRQLTRTVSLATSDGLLKELQFQPTALPGGGLLVSIQDDTENCRHEEQLRGMEAKLRTLMQSCPVAIVLTDKTGVIFEVNQHAEALLGQAKSELRRFPLDAWLDPDSATARRDALRVLRSQGAQAEALGVRVKRADGTFIDVIMHLAAVPDAQGEPHATIHYFQQPQDELAQPDLLPAEAELAAQVACVPPAPLPVTEVVTVELLTTDANGRIASWSEHAHELFDFDTAMAVGRPLHLLFRPSDATGFFTELAAQAAMPGSMIDHSFFGAQGRGSIPLGVTQREEGGFILTTRREIARTPDFPAVAPETSDEGENVSNSTESQPVAARHPRAVGTRAFQVVSPSSQRWPVVDLDREKLMLSETHHRIKNHLQIISSLLNLQISGVSDQHARNALRSSQNRVRAIAALHQHLYQLALGSSDTFSDFTRSLVQHLRDCYEATPEQIAVSLSIQDGSIQPEWLMPLALTLNEALSNSFEHAFPHGRAGTITATLSYTGEMGELVIHDDGTGLPHDFHPGDSPGLGLKILAVFAEQMRGQLFIHGTPDQGTEIKLRFPTAPVAQT
ncbi:MAG: PAS domain S-box protein [Verrucomicrobiaceae bacterium]|nr:PAS domain S-box protein [Verrucomicrobiaceae bacterium]